MVCLPTSARHTTRWPRRWRPRVPRRRVETRPRPMTILIMTRKRRARRRVTPPPRGLARRSTRLRSGTRSGQFRTSGPRCRSWSRAASSDCRRPLSAIAGNCSSGPGGPRPGGTRCSARLSDGSCNRVSTFPASSSPRGPGGFLRGRCISTGWSTTRFSIVSTRLPNRRQRRSWCFADRAREPRPPRSLGIRVVPSVAACLVELDELQRQRENPGLLERLRQRIGAS